MCIRIIEVLISEIDILLTFRRKVGNNISWSKVLSGMITGHSSEGKPGHAMDAFKRRSDQIGESAVKWALKFQPLSLKRTLKLKPRRSPNWEFTFVELRHYTYQAKAYRCNYMKGPVKCY
jgi:hypothetical protein